jgi:replicative DNA helicase
MPTNLVQQNARIMPHNNEAEQALLGCVLISDEAATNILNDVQSADFYAEAHRDIFQAMQDIFMKNKPIDFITLSDELEKSGNMQNIGGLDYLTMLTNIVPSAANYKHYQEIVKKDSVLRKLINTSQKIIEKAYTEDDDSLEFGEKAIYDIIQKEDKSSLESLTPSLGKVLEKFEDIYKNHGEIRGIETGFYELDRVTHGLQKSDLILLAARPGVGKTSLAMNIAEHAAISKKAHVAIFSLEMPKIQIAQRSICSVGLVDMEKAMSGKLSEDDWKKLWEANKKLSEANIYVDDNSLSNPATILSKCRRLKNESGLDLVMIDYLQLMSAPTTKANENNRQQQISDFTRSLKIAARELDVPIILLSQLSRAIDSRTDHKPMLSDLRESGAIEQDADIVMFIDKPSMYATKEEDKKNNLCNLIIAKHRNGSLAEIPLIWHGEYTLFSNPNSALNKMSLEATDPLINKEQNKTDENINKSNDTNKNNAKINENIENNNNNDTVLLKDSKVTDIF